MEKFQNKYRIPSTRLQNWDYRWEAAYFVTICTANREHFFGKIINGQMVLSHQGLLADVFWHEIKKHFKNVELDAFIVMPNHIHGIVIIENETNDAVNNMNVVTDNASDNASDNANTASHNASYIVPHTVETRHALSLQNEQNEQNEQNGQNGQSPPQQNQQPLSEQKTIGQMRFQNQGKNSLSSIIGSYKSVVTRHANRLGLPFGWQSRFHEHIIRDENSFEQIRKYILNNPKNWKEDRFFE